MASSGPSSNEHMLMAALKVMEKENERLKKQVNLAQEDHEKLEEEVKKLKEEKEVMWHRRGVVAEAAKKVVEEGLANPSPLGTGNCWLSMAALEKLGKEIEKP